VITNSDNTLRPLMTRPGNILILRGDLEILPPGRRTVSYNYLSQIVAEYLLGASPDVDISAALSIMPYTLSEYCPSNEIGD
jgi:hypothetical protein